ncbi:hypothetical protein GWI34_00930 [Actinomadura sp. DSM 109109]|nr:hypothetical protein [Actinomadura lepetitiana]
MSVVERYFGHVFDGLAEAVPSGPPEPCPGWRRAPGKPSWIVQLPSDIGDPLVEWSRDGGPSAVLDESGLATLLAYGAGPSCAEFGPQSGWPLHRMPPSARCAHPCSVWVIGDGDHGRYFPEHHQLRFSGPPRPAWSAIKVAVTAAAGVVSAHYGDYAYRLLVQEAGLVLGNLLLVARSMGLSVRPDERTPGEMDAALHLPNEVTLAALELRATVTAVRLGPARRVGDDVMRDCAAEVPAVHQAVRHSRFRGGRGQETPDGAGPEAGTRWSRIRRYRDSGDPGFVPSPRPVSPAAVARLCAAARGSAFPDIWSGLPPLRLLVAGVNVEGTPPALVFDEAPLPQDPVAFLRGCQMLPSANAHLAAATLFLLADRDEWLDRRAVRALLDLHLRAGEAAMRTLVAASADELVARVHNGFLTGPLRRLDGDRPWVAPFAIMISRPRPSARYRFDVGVGGKGR